MTTTPTSFLICIPALAESVDLRGVIVDPMFAGRPLMRAISPRLPALSLAQSTGLFRVGTADELDDR
jgi:hypothetical protein